MKMAGIVLCGGRGRRMGADKASLPFGVESMLSRIVRRLAPVVDHLVIVAAEQQELPPLADRGPNLQVVRDERPDRGPLEGVAAGLSAMPVSCEVAFVTSCDAPLLAPTFVERLFQLRAPDAEITLPRHGDRLHPLAGIYHRGVLPRVKQMLAADDLRLLNLLANCTPQEIEASQWSDIDPESHSLLNCNTPDLYAAALKIAFPKGGSTSS